MLCVVRAVQMWIRDALVVGWVRRTGAVLLGFCISVQWFVLPYFTVVVFNVIEGILCKTFEWHCSSSVRRAQIVVL